MKKTLQEEKSRILQIIKTNDDGDPIGSEYEKDSNDPGYDEPNDIDDRDIPTHSHEIDKFSNIDWRLVHEQLMINTELLAAHKTSDENSIAANVGDFIDNEMLTPEELQHLEDWGLIYIHEHFPIIEEDQYKDFNIFKTKAEEIWNKNPNIHQGGMEDDSPYLRGNEPMSENKK